MCDHVIYHVKGSNVNKMSVIHFRFCAKIETRIYITIIKIHWCGTAYEFR